MSVPSTWNSSPAHIRSIDTLKRHLEYSISSSLPLPSSHPVLAPQIRSHDFWRYTNLYAYVYVYSDNTICEHFQWLSSKTPWFVRRWIASFVRIQTQWSCGVGNGVQGALKITNLKKFFAIYFRRVFTF